MTTKDDIERPFRTHYVVTYRIAMQIHRNDGETIALIKKTVAYNPLKLAELS